MTLLKHNWKFSAFCSSGSHAESLTAKYSTPYLNQPKALTPSLASTPFAANYRKRSPENSLSLTRASRAAFPWRSGTQTCRGTRKVIRQTEFLNLGLIHYSDGERTNSERGALHQTIKGLKRAQCRLTTFLTARHIVVCSWRRGGGGGAST